MKRTVSIIHLKIVISMNRNLCKLNLQKFLTSRNRLFCVNCLFMFMICVENKERQNEEIDFLIIMYTRNTFQRLTVCL